MKKELTKKLIKAMISDDKCYFSEVEKKYISQLKIGTMSDFEEKKFFYLLINVKNNLEEKSKENISGILSHLAFDFEGSSIIEKTVNSNKFQYTFHQKVIYDYLGKKNLVLIAGTGFGKTTLFANYFIENYRKRKGKWVICVPTELLEQQLIMNLRENHQEFSEKIGNNIFKNDILILTPEKLFLASNADIKINQILVDEAHNLLSKNIDRMVFAQKEIIKHIDQVEHIYFATPFLDEENQKNFKKIFQKLELQCISIHQNNDKKNLVLQENTNYLTSINDEEYESKIQEEFDLPILIYENNKKNCIDLANEERKKNRNYKDIQSLENGIEWKKMKGKFRYKYLPFALANYGINYLHSDMPTQVKNMIIELVKKRHIKKIFATNAILNGIDLPFQHVLVNSTRIFRRDMTPSDFNNLRGRASRWNDEKRGNGLGLAIIKYDRKNIKWFDKNKNKLNDNSSASEIVEDDMTLFVNQSYKAYKQEKNEIYLLDPRISPITTKKIKENNFIELNNWKNLVFYRKKKDKKELEKFIKNLFVIYQLELYRGKFNKPTSNKSYLDPIITATRNYCQASFNVEVALQKYINSPLFKELEDNNLEWTKKLENALSRIKTYGKYFFIMFLSHYISMKSKKKFIEYLSYGSFDDYLIDAIKETNNSEKWILMVNETEEHDEKNGKRFCPKWKDYQTLIKGKSLSKKNEFIKEIIAYIQEKTST